MFCIVFSPLHACGEQSIDHEEIAVIVVMGGGTSDFTIAKLNRSVSDENKVLAIGGIHIAGTNFDQHR